MSGWGDDHEEAGHEEAGHDETGHVPAGHQQSGHEPRDGEPCGPVTGGGLYGWEDELAASAHLHASSTRASGEHQRLDLDDADRLPWLESDEDDYIENISPGRVIVAGLVALLVVAAVVGGIWWTTHRHAVGAPLPDGSVVTPSPAQYKEAPADPGGKTYQGTGDTSYVVSQGQNRQAQLADGEGSVAAGSAPPPAAAAGGNANAGAAAKGGSGAYHRPKAHQFPGTRLLARMFGEYSVPRWAEKRGAAAAGAAELVDAYWIDRPWTGAGEDYAQFPHWARLDEIEKHLGELRFTDLFERGPEPFLTALRPNTRAEVVADRERVREERAGMPAGMGPGSSWIEE